MITKFDGQLEIDHERGVIYFHSNTGQTLLRICSLPHPIHILEADRIGVVMNPLDVTCVKVMVNWPHKNAGT